MPEDPQSNDQLSAEEPLKLRETVTSDTGAVVGRNVTTAPELGLSDWSPREKAASTAAIWFIGIILGGSLAIALLDHIAALWEAGRNLQAANSGAGGAQCPCCHSSSPAWYEQTIFTILGGAIGFLFASVKAREA